MISEPELTGGPGEEPAEVIADPAAGALSGGPGRRPWVWAVGGAVVASALWGAGLRLWDAQHGGGPDLHGYVLGDSPCAGGTLGPLTSALHATDTAVIAPTAARLGKALDQARCTLEIYAPDPQTGSLDRFQVSVAIDLHKRTDPRREFEDQAGLDPQSLTPAVAVREVAGLGDEAVAQTVSRQREELHVLHGGAVFSLTLTGYVAGAVSEDTLGALHGGPRTAASDVARFEPAMVGAMRNVMKGQQKTAR